jgi:hypothetical protein
MQKVVLCDNNFGRLACVWYAHHENPYTLDAFEISRRIEESNANQKTKET